MIALLKARDGPCCWLCNRPIAEGAETIEHLQPRSTDGSDGHANLALCHRGCNVHLADRPVERKRRMRLRWHSQLAKQQSAQRVGTGVSPVQS